MKKAFEAYVTKMEKAELGGDVIIDAEGRSPRTGVQFRVSGFELGSDVLISSRIRVTVEST